MRAIEEKMKQRATAEGKPCEVVPTVGCMASRVQPALRGVEGVVPQDEPLPLMNQVNEATA